MSKTIRATDVPSKQERKADRRRNRVIRAQKAGWYAPGESDDLALFIGAVTDGHAGKGF